MDTHYVCNGGCNGVSETPGVCGAETCAKAGMPLTPCTCEDHKHDGVMTACQHCGSLCKADGPGCAMQVQPPELTS
ncbi:MAG: hypothetical protein KA052_02220 [Candidatus Pacebacteria bacterium]|nr:hypothetical protein [Candidatus Paceibacterota bacterium]